MPQIMPFGFGEDSANAGDFITAQCAVMKGDSPIAISWQFNNTDIVSNDGIMISMRGRRISDMTIEAVRAEHSGAYTCVASNAAGLVNHTAYLHVNGINKLHKNSSTLHVLSKHVSYPMHSFLFQR